MPPSARTAPTFAGCRIEAELGRGGMGVVYRATQLRLERPVALKVMAPELARDERFRQRFERESRLAASIDHPHVIPIYEADEERERLYLVMRYVPGPDLGQLIAREGRLGPVRAARLTAQVGSALDAAHQSGLVHRDIKPANVLIAGEGQAEHAYLSDFGLTKRTTSESGITRTGVFLGTVDYVAPEQLRGERIDARADIYSLAGLLFHAFTGEVPFPRDDDMAKMFAHGHTEPPKPSALVPGLGPQFDGVIARGMAKDPAERYPSAGDLGRAALAAAQGEQRTAPERSVAAGAAAPIAVPPSPPPPRPPAPRQTRPERREPPERRTTATRVIHGRRSRLPLALAAAVLLALGVGAGVLAATLGGGEDPKSDRTSAREGSGESGREDAAAAPTEQAADPSQEQPGGLGNVPYEPYSPASGGYQTMIPSGDDWVLTPETEPSPGIRRTTVTGPRGLELRIDYTPAERAQFFAGDKQVQSHRESPSPRLAPQMCGTSRAESRSARRGRASTTS